MWIYGFESNFSFGSRIPWQTLSLPSGGVLSSFSSTALPHFRLFKSRRIPCLSSNSVIFYIPYICQFWGIIKPYGPVIKGTEKCINSRQNSQNGHNGPKLRAFYANKGTGFKKVHHHRYWRSWLIWAMSFSLYKIREFRFLFQLDLSFDNFS